MCAEQLCCLFFILYTRVEPSYWSTCYSLSLYCNTWYRALCRSSYYTCSLGAVGAGRPVGLIAVESRVCVLVSCALRGWRALGLLRGARSLALGLFGPSLSADARLSMLCSSLVGVLRRACDRARLAVASDTCAHVYWWEPYCRFHRSPVGERIALLFYRRGANNNLFG